MTDRDRIKLLFGPYRPPALRRGDRAVCLYKDSLVVVTAWTDAPIPWPRCRPLEGHGGGSGLLVDEELARAVRHESAAAIKFWWGVGDYAVWSWRKALGVSRTNNEGSWRLISAAFNAGAEAVAEREWTPEELEAKRQRAKEMNLPQYMRKAQREDRWTEEEMALLGTMLDEEVARKIKRTVQAVRLKRVKLGFPPFITQSCRLLFLWAALARLVPLFHASTPAMMLYTCP
jgi:hypothetical protein